MATLIAGLAVGAVIAGAAVLGSAQESSPSDPVASASAKPIPTESAVALAPTPSYVDAPPQDTSPPGLSDQPEAQAASGVEDLPPYQPDVPEADTEDLPGQQARTEAAQRKALKHACKKGRWQTLQPRNVPDQTYRNQGDCVSDIASQGRARQARQARLGG